MSSPTPVNKKPTAKKSVELPDFISVRDLATAISASPIIIIKQLMQNGVMANINQMIDFDTAAIVAEELGWDAKPLIAEVEEESQDDLPAWRKIIDKEKQSDLKVRPPVVTILGHVDHGKTSLLDAIRQANVAAGEAGGITQHIGAYQVIKDSRSVTFLDTPGHEAFTAMRARGAQATDIAILVVAADDGVMPQTKEAAAHAKAAKVPIIVAMNKVDKLNANPDRVKRQLSEIGLNPDDWGGDTMVIPVSALKKQGIDDLLEAILLTADEAKKIVANPKSLASGTVIEAERHKAKGAIATLLVQNGTLKIGDSVVCGTVYGRIRAMFDFHGKPVREAAPSVPVEVMGLSEVPNAGDLFVVMPNERDARNLALARLDEKKKLDNQPKQRMTLDQVFSQIASGKAQELNVIVKADVQGSLEPIVNSIQKLSTDDVKIKLLYSDTGNIGENDILLASASKAVVVGFNVKADNSALSAAETNGVEIRTYNIIYRLLEDLEKAIKGMLEPEYKETKIGFAEVRATFKIPKIGVIAGCSVRDGEIRRNGKAKVLRGGKQIHMGTIGSLKHEKADVRDVRSGFECGIGLDDFSEFKEGDIIECYITEQVS
ncbi:MAG TPA: translation initiation factor IF-2 [Anaerolineales bacterium]|nr:translation initiation factor IF-2 [Anaerolineales bacterium]